MQRHFPQCPFARYADDAVVHCRSQAQAQEVMQAIAARLAECGLRRGETVRARRSAVRPSLSQ
ncbi:hypothetical protein P0D84_34785 [Paraburkholderia sp. RL17-337-BIB-A]|uniref:hypothetical protein n=1 Tax=Paraburkholderia sp. RL17-337-BIB-A TaxID=3031636 RepID=UPI0038B8CCF7